jgi:hypothetical protein
VKVDYGVYSKVKFDIKSKAKFSRSNSRKYDGVDVMMINGLYFSWCVNM